MGNDFKFYLLFDVLIDCPAYRSHRYTQLCLKDK